MSNTTKQLLPSQIGCIDREWLREKKRLLNIVINSNLPSPHIESCKNQLSILETVESQLFSIEPILNDAFGYGYGCGFNDSDFEERKKRNLTQPITIKL